VQTLDVPDFSAMSLQQQQLGTQEVPFELARYRTRSARQGFADVVQDAGSGQAHGIASRMAISDTFSIRFTGRRNP
jgi:hypothetical protein